MVGTSVGRVVTAVGHASVAGAPDTSNDPGSAGLRGEGAEVNHPPLVMFAQLRPDRVETHGELVQHVIRPTRAEAHTVPTFCGQTFAATDLDPRFAHVMRGAPCAVCVARAPQALTMDLQRVSGTLDDVPDLAASHDPIGRFVYASCLAGLELRHIVPERAPRFPYQGRMVLTVECGHMAWCPQVGPWPSVHWPVCAECAEVVRRRTAIDVPADDPVELPSPGTGGV